MKTKIILGSAALLIAAMVVAALLMRRSGPLEHAPAKRPPSPAPAVSAPLLTSRPVYQPPASSDVIATASYEAKVRTTYENYRSALATGNVPLVDALRPILLRDREIALRVARHETRSSRSPADRQIAVQVLESLERAR